MKVASSQMRGCALVAQRRRHLICRGPGRPPGDQGDRRAQEDQNGAEDDKPGPAPQWSAMAPTAGGIAIAASRFMVWRSPTTEP